MLQVNLYHTNVSDWDIAWLKTNLEREDLSLLESIKHAPTLNRKIVNKALLRHLLTNCFRIPPECIIFDYNNRGKPFLKSHPSIYFNCSHSEDLVLIGISEDCVVGVDIELIKQLPDEDGIAKSFFSNDEYASYRDYRLRYPHAFYQFWTAKEAIIKALGKGLWEAYDVPEIICQHNQFSLKSESKAFENWTLAFLDIHSSYSACLLASRKDIEIKIYDIKPIHLSASSFAKS